MYDETDSVCACNTQGGQRQKGSIYMLVTILRHSLDKSYQKFLISSTCYLCQSVSRTRAWLWKLVTGKYLERRQTSQTINHQVTSMCLHFLNPLKIRKGGQIVRGHWENERWEMLEYAATVTLFSPRNLHNLTAKWVEICQNHLWGSWHMITSWKGEHRGLSWSNNRKKYLISHIYNHLLSSTNPQPLTWSHLHP